MTAPNVEHATKNGMTLANLPYILLAKVTATASEPSTSEGLSVVWKATMVNT